MKQQLPRLNRLQAVFFDFDGVILESAAIKDQAFEGLFSYLSDDLPRILEYHRKHLGLSRFDKFEWIYREVLGRELEKKESLALGREFSEFVRRSLETCDMTPGILDLLTLLSGSADCFVVSGTPQEELDELVDARNLRRYFVEVWGSPNTKPEVFTDIITRYDLSPPHTLAIGDAISDYQAAIATAVPFVARISPGSDQGWEQQPVRSVRSLDELIPLLTEQEVRVP